MNSRYIYETFVYLCELALFASRYKIISIYANVKVRPLRQVLPAVSLM